MKKLAITFVFSVGMISVLLMACCKGVQPYWKPDSGAVTVIAHNDSTFYQVYNQDTVQADFIEMALTFQTVFVSQQSSQSIWQMGNVARASQKCPLDGHKGLKYALEDVTIISDQDYNQYSAGEDLEQVFSDSMDNYFSDIFQPYEYEYIENGMKRSVFLKEQPGSSVERKFTFIFEFSNGQVIEMTTPSFTW